jgi:hypothetical protein
MTQERDDRSQQQQRPVEDEARKALQRSIDWQDRGGDSK